MFIGAFGNPAEIFTQLGIWIRTGENEQLLAAIDAQARMPMVRIGEALLALDLIQLYPDGEIFRFAIGPKPFSGANGSPIFIAPALRTSSRENSG